MELFLILVSLGASAAGNLGGPIKLNKVFWGGPIEEACRACVDEAQVFVFRQWEFVQPYWCIHPEEARGFHDGPITADAIV